MNEHFRGTLDRAKADLLNRGIGSGYVAPPALRFLWKIGVSIKPPICMTFIGMFTYYSLGFGLGILVIALPFGFNQLIPALIVSPLAGMGFGTIMTIKTIRERRRMDPPSWTEYLDIPDDSHN